MDTEATPPGMEPRDRAIAKSARWRAFYRRFETRPEFAAAMILSVLIVFMAFATRTFLTTANIVWVALSFSTVAIAALGMLLVIASGSIDLSVGSQMGLSAVVAGWFVYVHPGTPDLVVFAAAAGSGIAFGLVNGLLVAKWGLNAFIATLGTGYIGRGLAVILSNDRTYSGFSDELLYLGQGTALGLPVPVWIMLALAVFWTVFLGRTVFGQYIFAVGGNRSAARLSGVPVVGVSVSAFVLSGLMGATAGFILSCRLGMVQQNIGLGYEMDVIAAAVIGGTSIQGGAGSIVGVVIGAALMATIRNCLVLLQIGDFWQLVVTGFIIVAAVALDSLRGGVWFGHWPRRLLKGPDKRSLASPNDGSVRGAAIIARRDEA
jgi:ribose/xylose/arabinose/galactoside ABC-type transport system permease subunit